MNENKTWQQRKQRRWDVRHGVSNLYHNLCQERVASSDPGFRQQLLQKIEFVYKIEDRLDKWYEEISDAELDEIEKNVLPPDWRDSINKDFKPETHREELTRYLWIIDSWTNDKIPGEIISTFINIDELDQSRDTDLWHRLREILRENPYLHDPDVLGYIAIDYLATDDKWWWDPKRW